MGLNAMAEDRSAAVVEAAYGDTVAHAARPLRASASPPCTTHPPRRLTSIRTPGHARELARAVDRATIDDLRARERSLRGAASTAPAAPRPPRLGARRPAGIAIDLGAGPAGTRRRSASPWSPFDAAPAMVHAHAEVAPRQPPGVQATSCALPFRRGGLAAGWARQHVRARPPGRDADGAQRPRTASLAARSAPIEVTVFAGPD
jgi:hypothetical protein